jgi:hypothetical protein
MTKRPQSELRPRFQLPHWSKARVVPFREENRVFMQDIGGKEDTELSKEDLTPS